jgi:hypothetical protein
MLDPLTVWGDDHPIANGHLSADIADPNHFWIVTAKDHRAPAPVQSTHSPGACDLALNLSIDSTVTINTINIITSTTSLSNLSSLWAQQVGLPDSL